MKKISVGGVKAGTEQARHARDYPMRPKPFFNAVDAKKLKCIQVGIEVEPIFQQEGDGLFPNVLKLLRRKMGYALQHGFFHFVEHQTFLKPKNYHSLGRHALVASVWKADAKLHSIAASFDFC